jgi:sugar phosphate isomerase/epimerase
VTRRLALAHLTAIKLSPWELIEVAAAGGFDAVTLRLLPSRPGDDYSPLVGDRARLAETSSRLAARGVSVLEVEALHLSGTTQLDAIMPGLEAASALGARHVLVVGDEADEARLAARLHELCERAAPLGLRPVLEFIPFTLVSSLEIARRVVEAADHPAAGILVDALHLSRSGGSPAEVGTLAARRPELFPYAQLCDAPLAAPADGNRGLYREAVHARRLPGEGELPLAGLLAALPDGVPLSLEVPGSRPAETPVSERVAEVGRVAREWLQDRDR